MRRHILIYTIISYLIVGWTFLFASTISVNIISNSFQSTLRNDDTFKDISYSDLNKYDLQSTLMLKQDYFNQGLDPSNYAFSFGIKIPTLDNVSVLPSDNNYWFNKFQTGIFSFILNWKYEFSARDLNYHDSRSVVAKFTIDPIIKKNLNLITISTFINGINYKFTFGYIDIFKYLFIPYFSNQSYRSFTLNYLVFNFNYKKFFTQDLLKKINTKFYINDILQDSYSINDFFNVMYNFYSTILKFLFTFNLKTLIHIESNSYFGFVWFVKNGFILYPKSMIFNIIGSTEKMYNVNTTFYNAFKVNSNIDYFSFYSNWQYTTDYLPYQYKVATATLMDMTDTSKYQGFNVFEMKSNSFNKDMELNIYGFNFSIYNSADWNNELNSGDIWKIPYKSCGITHILGCFENAFIWAFNNVPGIDYVGQFIGALVHIFSDVNTLFDNIIDLFAFDITFKIMLGSLITLAMVNGLIRIIG